MTTEPIRVVNVKGLKGDARSAVCYVGRAFAGWNGTPWGNPFRPKPLGPGAAGNDDSEESRVRRCLDEFRRHAARQPESWLADLWEACDHGRKPLGCWCLASVYGDG